MGCELCGKEEFLVKALIENSHMNVCKNCGKFGKILSVPVQQKSKTVIKQKKEEPIIDVVDDFAKKIRSARESAGLTQKDFAKRLNEKETLMSKIENGEIKPPIPLAQKLEKLLKIKLLNEINEDSVLPSAKKSAALTIGDIIEQKKTDSD